MFSHLRSLVARYDPIAIILIALSCILLGILFIKVPTLVAWVLGIAGVLLGVATLAALLTADPR